MSIEDEMFANLKSEKDENTKNELMKAIRPKFEAWYDTEVLNFNNVRGVLRKADSLMNKLRSSEVANAIGLREFNYACRLAKHKWYRYLDRNFTGKLGIMTSKDMRCMCYNTYITLKNSVIPDEFKFKTVNELKTILEALKSWERESMVNTKLNSIEEDFK